MNVYPTFHYLRDDSVLCAHVHRRRKHLDGQYLCLDCLRVFQRHGHRNEFTELDVGTDEFVLISPQLSK
ncbi:MAG: hypothetical protein C7B43_20405 [Sulfobacillus benefaciens]|uniref:Uncharacterized protein n=1 Tax=Sulfobacillus benefaciens TaxID=453960 RepID=A0A2T2WL95_9FIRM|nr:MAG: hypothetical protein C7B43_20405 [Sulfobacillus benefaciens]HBQ94567.1 hypothetical protein [Sulfobacillus sp.]